MSKINNFMIRKVAEYKSRDEEGQGLAEYGLILALVAIACVAALGLLGGGLAGRIEAVTAAL